MPVDLSGLEHVANIRASQALSSMNTTEGHDRRSGLP